MKQWTTVLVTRQDDLSRVYEARKQKVTFTRGPLTLLTTEKNKYGWVNGIVRLIEDQKAQVRSPLELSPIISRDPEHHE